MKEHIKLNWAPLFSDLKQPAIIIGALAVILTIIFW